MDGRRLQDDAERILVELIRFDTSNPPGNETPAARFVAAELAEAGYSPELLEPEAGRGNVVARLEGSGRGETLLLFGHLDVVPAEADRWSHPPFAGEIEDGFLYGRGALDMKHVVASQLATMRELARSGVRTNRDVVFAATADEETGGRRGIVWLRDNHPHLIGDVRYGLTEFGGFSLEVGGRRFYMCQTAEKGFAWIRIRARGRPGHSSLPHPDSAIRALCEAVCRLETHRAGLHVCPTTRAMLEAMARVEPSLAALLDPAAGDAALPSLPPELAGMMDAVLRTTVAVTTVEAGYGTNVVPGLAEADVDVRIPPGRTVEDALFEVRALVGDGIEIELMRSSPPAESPLDTELYATLVAHLERSDPGAEVLPLLLPGGTDGRHLARRGVVTYGYGPLRLPPGMKFLELVHGDDERIPLRAYREGALVFAQTVVDFCT
jgi:acetylornithine deacetylase/succinyl-diaminopimelate desuccinylase-like protein